MILLLKDGIFSKIVQTPHFNEYRSLEFIKLSAPVLI